MDKVNFKIYLNHDRVNKIAQYLKLIKYYQQRISDEIDAAFLENGHKIPDRRCGNDRRGHASTG